MLIALSATVGAVGPASGQDRAHRAGDPRTWVGERLQYEVTFLRLRLGRAEMEVAGVDTVRGAPSLHIRFLLEGGPSFYRLHNVWDSWIGLHDFASRRFVQDHDEGGKKYRNAYEIFPDSGYYRQEGVDTVATTSALPLDDAAFFYFVRTVELVPGSRYEFHRYFKPDRNPVVLEVLGRDTIDVPAGRFPTLVVQPIIKGGGIFKEGAEGRMWITDDDRRIVVQVRAKLFIGSLTLRLRTLEASPRSAESP